MAYEVLNPFQRVNGLNQGSLNEVTSTGRDSPMKETTRIFAAKPEQVVLLTVVVVTALVVFVHSHFFGL
jgi:hypothetical protein